MKAVPFDYVAANSADEALSALTDAGDDGMVLAGGQTLVPMLAMRLARPAILVDINRVAEWSGIAMDGGAVSFKTCTRQSAALTSSDMAQNLPLLAKALPLVGHQQTRNRGTVGGSIAHGDPAAEIPLVATALEAEITLSSSDGNRVVKSGDFYEGPMMSVREPGECVTDVSFPIWEGGQVGADFQEVVERHGDFAIVSAAAQLQWNGDGTCVRAALAVGGAGGTPVRLSDAEGVLAGSAVTEESIADALSGLDGALDPADDLHGSADYRRRVARVLMTRAIENAAAEARGSTT